MVRLELHRKQTTMKRSPLVLVAFCLSILSALGQGQVNFQNSSIITPIYVEGAPMSTNSSFTFYFTYGLAPDSLVYQSPTYLNSSTIAGRIAGTGTGSLVLTTPANTTTYFQLYAYETAAGSFWNAVNASNLYRSYLSAVIATTPSMDPNPGTPLFGSAGGSQFKDSLSILLSFQSHQRWHWRSSVL